MHKFDVKKLDKLDNPLRRETMPPSRILKDFGIVSEGVLLDIGCGIGYFTIPAAELLKNGKAIGIDIMKEMIEHAEGRAVGIENLEFKKCEEYEFPIESQSIDNVFVCNVMHEIEDKVMYLQEIKRVLKPGGSLSIVDWEKKVTEQGPPVDERVSVEEISELFTSNNFVFDKAVDINVNHYGVKFILK